MRYRSSQCLAADSSLFRISVTIISRRILNFNSYTYGRAQQQSEDLGQLEFSLYCGAILEEIHGGSLMGITASKLPFNYSYDSVLMRFNLSLSHA